MSIVEAVLGKMKKSHKKSMKSKSKKCDGMMVMRKVKGRKSRKSYCLNKSALKKIRAGGRKGGKRSHKHKRSSRK